jgi:hypothetical protein
MLKFSKSIFSQRLKKIAKEKMKYLLKYLVIFYLSNWNSKLNNEKKTRKVVCHTLALLFCGKFKHQTSKQLKYEIFHEVFS